MRTACMCFSVLQGPRCGIQYFLKGNLFLQPNSVVNYSTESFPSLRSIPESSCKPVDSNTCRASREGPNTGKWRQETLRMKEQRKADITQSSTPCTIKPDDILDATVTVDHKINISKSDFRDSKHIEYDVQVKVEESQKIQRLVTIFVFDSETTGLSKGNDRIIEFALRDLVGGENSTFQSLVNPERHVPNTRIHGISTHMVNRPDVPRFAELIPILLHYVQTRQISGAPVLWVAHNARSFDVPFLINEFNRCSVEIPSDWLFLDTLPLAHELNKLEGPKLLAGKSLKALREFYKIPLVGEAHRAMADVDSLSKVLRHMTIDLKLSVPALLERSFKASDIIINTKKKTTN